MNSWVTLPTFCGYRLVGMAPHFQCGIRSVRVRLPAQSTQMAELADASDLGSEFLGVRLPLCVLGVFLYFSFANINLFPIFVVINSTDLKIKK